jgi:hypothetical protein
MAACRGGRHTLGIKVSENPTIPPPKTPRIAKGVPPRNPHGGFDIERVLVAALGIGAMIAGGILITTPAGVPLIGAGGGLVGWTIPYRRRRQ